MRHVSCILLLEWSTTSQRLWVYRISVPYAQKDPRFLFEKRRGQPREFWSLVSTIDGSTLPQVGVEELLCENIKYLVKHTKKKKSKKKIPRPDNKAAANRESVGAVSISLPAFQFEINVSLVDNQLEFSKYVKEGEVSMFELLNS